MRALLANFAAGIRLALFLPVGRDRFRADMDQVICLFLLGTAMAVAGEFITAAPGHRFNADAAGYACAELLAPEYLIR